MTTVIGAGIGALVAFALALYALREAIAMEKSARIGRWVLLAAAAGGGALLLTVTATLIGAVWSADPIGHTIADLPMRVLVTYGVVLGLACVVLGPALRDAVLVVIRRRAGGGKPPKGDDDGQP